jgi:guanylate kinase
MQMRFDVIIINDDLEKARREALSIVTEFLETPLNKYEEK